MQSFKLYLLSVIACIAAFGLTLSPARAVPTLLIDSGQLLGADNVDVAGSLYDVRFVDGTCADLYAGCGVFPFPSQASATVAGQALLDQVFLDSGSGLFDTDPETTAGCTSILTCQVLIPVNTFLGSLLANVVVSNSSGTNDVVGTTNISRFEDLTANAGRTFAVFTVSDSIPEPSVVAIFGIGLLGVATMRRRVQRA